METRLEINEKFELPDKGRNLIREILGLMAVSFVAVVLLFIVICHADVIDAFFSRCATTLFLYVPGAPCLAVAVRIYLFILGNFLRKKETILSGTTEGDGSFI
jgi:hypothetical protein